MVGSGIVDQRQPMSGAQRHPARLHSGRTPAVFLDRDGTLNVEQNYLHQIGDWKWIEGAQEAIRRFNQAGFKVVVVSNQAGIARGMFGADDVEKLHAFVSTELQAIGAWIDAFYYCPHHPEFGNDRTCSCRKPAPGMLFRAADDLVIDLSRSWMIGDKLTDVEAGRAADLSTILVRTGYGHSEAALSEPGQIIADNLLAACQYILGRVGKSSICNN